MQHVNSKKSKLVFEILSKIIKEERQKQGKSIRILAYEYDLQNSLICRLENCKNEPKLISLWSVCEALNLKLSDLIKKIEKELPKDFTLFEK